MKTCLLLLKCVIDLNCSLFYGNKQIEEYFFYTKGSILLSDYFILIDKKAKYLIMPIFYGLYSNEFLWTSKKRKAFDRVNLNKLLIKLIALGTLRIFFKTAIFGPLLFILIVNYLCEKLQNCFFLFYADDLKIIKVIRGVEDAMIYQQNIVNVN